MAPKRKRPSGGGSASTKGVFNVWGKCTAENYLSLIFFFLAFSFNAWFFFWFFCALCTDELLKRNLLLNRYALDNRRETLGKKNRKKKIGRGGTRRSAGQEQIVFFYIFFRSDRH
jgi:hypothetical protein